jgi:hypothetical protein
MLVYQRVTTTVIFLSVSEDGISPWNKSIEVKNIFGPKSLGISVALSQA